MINDFLIINCTGSNDSIGLRVNNNFFIHKIQTNIKKNDILVSRILNLFKQNNARLNEHFSILVNQGPGSFSSIRTSLAVAKGIQISKKVKLFGYNDSNLAEFNLKNIEILIKKNLLENKLINPVYIS